MRFSPRTMSFSSPTMGFQRARWGFTANDELSRPTMSFSRRTMAFSRCELPLNDLRRLFLGHPADVRAVRALLQALGRRAHVLARDQAQVVRDFFGAGDLQS